MPQSNLQFEIKLGLYKLPQDHYYVPLFMTPRVGLTRYSLKLGHVCCKYVMVEFMSDIT